MHRTLLAGAIIFLAAILGCEETTAPIPGGASIAEMRQRLGSYTVVVISTEDGHVAGVPTKDGAVLIASSSTGSMVTSIWRDGASTPLQAPNGTFLGSAMNNVGDVVGRLDSVPAFWKAGAAAPTVLFPNEPAMAAKRTGAWLNDRGEVLVIDRTGPRDPGIWKGGSYSDLSVCEAYGINNRGMILSRSCMGLYDTWTLTPSPYGGESVDNQRLAGRSCTYQSVHGRTSYGLAVNDSNEVIDSDNAWVTPSGCVRLGQRPIGFNSRGVLLAYPPGFACTPTSCDVAVQLITVEGVVPLDSLLAPGPASQYRVIKAIGINDAGQISGVVRRKSDNAWLAVLFNPIR